MQDIMNKNSYYKIRMLFKKFEQQASKVQSQKDKKISFVLHDLVDAIKFFVLAYLFIFIVMTILNYMYPINSNINTIALQCYTILLIPIVNFFILKKQRTKIINELGEEYSSLFLSQINFSRDILLKKTILFQEFLKAENSRLTQKEIEHCIQYIQESEKYPNFKIQSIFFKSSFTILGIWLGAFLQKDSTTDQSLFTSFSAILYIFIITFFCLFLIDIFFKKPMRDFCFILITYKELYYKE